MSQRSNRVCPVEMAGGLDNRVRRLFQNPKRILRPYIRPGMTVLDIGCGPGYFSLDMAQMVSESGRVIAADLQEGMIQKLRRKIAGTELEERIILHKCEQDKIGLSQPVDFVLLFYVVHEIPDKQALFDEIAMILNWEGQVLMVEPLFHVSQKAFEQTIDKANNAGLTIVSRQKVLFSKAVVLSKVPSNEGSGGFTGI